MVGGVCRGRGEGKGLGKGGGVIAFFERGEGGRAGGYGLCGIGLSFFWILVFIFWLCERGGEVYCRRLWGCGVDGGFWREGERGKRRGGGLLYELSFLSTINGMGMGFCGSGRGGEGAEGKVKAGGREMEMVLVEERGRLDAG